MADKPGPNPPKHDATNIAAQKSRKGDDGMFSRINISLAADAAAMAPIATE